MIFLLALLWGGVGRLPAAEPLQRFEFAEPHMGTTWRIVLYAADEPAAKAASRAAFDRVKQLDGTLSDYKADSELMALCRVPPGKATVVSNDLFAVLDRGQDMARKSDGAFDATVGPLVKLWRRSRRTQLLPPADQLADARAKVGFDKLTLDATKRTATLAVPGMQLDLGGIAKGYAAGAALKVLADRGLRRALVAGGGDIAVGDAPPGESGWKVAIAAQGVDSKSPSVRLTNTHISTSGDAEQWVEIGGVRYAHILDPRTGMGLRDIWAVTAVGGDGATNDSLATACAVLGPKAGAALVEKYPGTSARWVRGTTVEVTPKFPPSE